MMVVPLYGPLVIRIVLPSNWLSLPPRPLPRPLPPPPRTPPPPPPGPYSVTLNSNNIYYHSYLYKSVHQLFININTYLTIIQSIKCQLFQIYINPMVIIHCTIHNICMYVCTHHVVWVTEVQTL